MAKSQIPVYNAVISGDDTGMDKISLVEYPAVETDFIQFAQEQKKAPLKMAVEDEEKRLIFGVVMRADFPIYRFNDKMGEYYIVFSKDVIRTMAERYLEDSKSNNINLQHEDGSDVEGVHMTQWFIKDSEKGISPSAFADIEEGSLFAEFHCENDEVWEGVKNGEFKGFSLEGFFDLEPVKQDMSALLMEAYNELSKQSNNMTLIERMKAALAEKLAEEAKKVQFASVATDNGTLLWEGDDALAIDTAVYVEDADGNRTEASEGEYKTDDKVIVVVDGKVSEIKDKEAEETPTEDENKKEDEQKMRAMVAERYAKIREAFSYSLDNLYQQLYALVPDTDNLYHYIVEMFNDYCIMSVWDYDTNTESYVRYNFSVSEDGVVSLGESMEVERTWAEKGEAPKEDEEKEQMKAQIADLQTKLSEAEEKLAKTPQGKSAHEAFKSAQSNGSNPISDAMKYIR